MQTLNLVRPPLDGGSVSLDDNQQVMSLLFSDGGDFVRRDAVLLRPYSIIRHGMPCSYSNFVKSSTLFNFTRKTFRPAATRAS